MKVYIAKTLVETPDGNSCSVEMFKTRSSANEWVSNEIDTYAQDYDEPEITKHEDFYRMFNNKWDIFGADMYVTIEIEEKELDL